MNSALKPRRPSQSSCHVNLSAASWRPAVEALQGLGRASRSSAWGLRALPHCNYRPYRSLRWAHEVPSSFPRFYPAMLPHVTPGHALVTRHGVEEDRARSKSFHLPVGAKAQSHGYLLHPCAQLSRHGKGQTLKALYMSPSLWFPSVAFSLRSIDPYRETRSHFLGRTVATL